MTNDEILHSVLESITEGLKDYKFDFDHKDDPDIMIREMKDIFEDYKKEYGDTILKDEDGNQILLKNTNLVVGKVTDHEINMQIVPDMKYISFDIEIK